MGAAAGKKDGALGAPAGGEANATRTAPRAAKQQPAARSLPRFCICAALLGAVARRPGPAWGPAGAQAASIEMNAILSIDLPSPSFNPGCQASEHCSPLPRPSCDVNDGSQLQLG